MRKIVNTILAGALGLTMIAGVAAEEPPPPVAVVKIESSGLLSATITTIDFETQGYKFTEQTANATVNVNVLDGRGIQAGWNVTVTANGDLKHGTDASKSIPLENLNIPSTTPMLVTEIGGQPVTDDIKSFGASPVQVTGSTSVERFASAEQGSGAGSYNFSSTATLLIPGGTVIGEYKTTLTVTTASGPGN